MRIRLRDRFRYRAELVFFRYWTLGLAAALVGASLAMLAMGTVLAVVVGVRFGGEAEPATPVEAAWHSLTRLLDGGTFSQDEEWPTRASMLMVTLGGMPIVSAFVGVVTEGIRSKTAQWREGRAPVDEQGHSLVLGWGPMVYSTLQELCVAGENQASSRIVLMSELPRLEMESLLQARRKNRHGTRIVGRSGRPSDIDDLILVQAHHANSVITPPSKTSIDATTIKTVLAVAEESRRLGSEPHMIAPIFRQSFVTVARLAALEPGVGDVDGSRRSDRERIVTCPCPDPVHPQPVGRHGAEGSDGTGRRHRRPDPARVSRRPRVLEQDLLRDAGERRGAEAVLSHRDQVRRTALRRAGAQSRTNRRSALVPDIPLIVAFGIGPIMRMFGGGNALASRPIGLGTSTHRDGATAGGGVSRQQSGKDARIPEA